MSKPSDMITFDFNHRDVPAKYLKNQRIYVKTIDEMIQTQKQYVDHLEKLYKFLSHHEADFIEQLGGKKNADFAKDYLYSLEVAIKANKIVADQMSATFFIENSQEPKKSIQEADLIQLQNIISKSIQANTNLMIGYKAMFPSPDANKLWAVKNARMNELANQYFKSTEQNTNFSFRAIQPVQRGPKYDTFFGQGFLETLDVDAQKVFSNLMTKPLSQANRDANEAGRNGEVPPFKELSLTIKDVGIEALKEILEKKFKNQVVLEKDPRNPKHYIIFAATPLGKKRAELPLASITLHGADVVIQPYHNRPMQWSQVNDFCMSLATHLSQHENALGCEIHTDNRNLELDLFHQGIKQGVHHVFLSKATQEQFFKDFRIPILLEGNFETVIRKIQNIVSLGFIPVLTEDDIKKLKELKLQYRGEKVFQLYLPPIPTKPNERAGLRLREAQIRHLEPLYQNKVIKGERPIERVSNSPEPLIEQVKLILENGDLPDPININAQHRGIIKAYIAANPYSVIHLITVDIKGQNVENIQAQVSLALELGLVPKVLHPEIVLQQRAQFLTLPDNHMAILTAQYKSLVAAGYSINFLANDPIKAKIMKQLDSSLLEARNLEVPLPSESTSESRIVMIKRLNEMMKLGFVPELSNPDFFNEFDSQKNGYTIIIEHLNPDVILRQYQFAQAHGLNVQFSEAAYHKFISKFQSYTEAEPVKIHCIHPQECLRRIQETLHFGLIPKLDKESQEAILNYQDSLSSKDRQEFEEITFNLQSQKPEIVLQKMKSVIAMGLIPVLKPKDEKRIMNLISKLHKTNKEQVIIQKHPDVASLEQAVQLSQMMKKLSLEFDPGTLQKPNLGNIEDLIKKNYTELDTDIEKLAKEMDTLKQQMLNKQKDKSTILRKEDYDSMVKELAKVRRKYDELHARVDKLGNEVSQLGLTLQFQNLFANTSKKLSSTNKPFSKLMGTIHSLHLSSIQRATQLLREDVLTSGKMDPDARLLAALDGTLGRSNDTLIMGRKFTQEVAELTPKRQEFSSHESTVPKAALDTLEHSMNVLKARKHTLQKQQKEHRKSPEEEIQQAKQQINNQIKDAIARFLKAHDTLLTQMLPEKYKKQLSENFNKSEDPVLEVRNLWDVIYEARNLRYDKNAKVRHDNAIEYTKILNDLTSLEEYGMKTRHSLKRVGPNLIQESIDKFCKEHRTLLQNSLVELLSKDKLLPGSAEKVKQLEKVLQTIERFEFPREQDKGVHERVVDLKNVLWDANVLVVQKKGNPFEIQAMEQALKEFEKTLPKPAIPPKPKALDRSEKRPLPPPPPVPPRPTRPRR